MNRWRILLLGLAIATTANCRLQTDGLAEATGLPAGAGGRADSGIATTPTGGTPNLGDAPASGARAGTGGAGAGGSSDTGGVSQAGGAPGAGGASTLVGNGGVSGAGGASNAGGATNMGGSGGKAGTGGAPGSGGASTGGGSTTTTGTGGIAGAGGADNEGGTGGGLGSGGGGGSGGNTTLTGNGGISGTGGAGSTQLPDAAPDLPRPAPPDASPDAPPATGDETSRDIAGAQPDIAPPLDANSSLRLIWSDEFNGATNTGVDPNKWSYVTWDPGHVNDEIQKYTSRLDNVYLDGNGCLVIQALNVPYQGFAYTSGRITTQNTQLLGPGVRVEVRAKLPAGIGSFPGIVMLGATGAWPNSGELAIAEQYGQDKSWMYVSAYADTTANGSTGNIRHNYANATTASVDFHVYAVDWYADHLDFQVDGTTVVVKPFPGSSPFASIQEYINLDLALGGAMGGNVNNAAFPMDMKMTVDYVRVYSLQ